MTKKESHTCSGHRRSGYWKGYPCGASGLYFKNDKWWCKNHIPLDVPITVNGVVQVVDEGIILTYNDILKLAGKEPNTYTVMFSNVEKDGTLINGESIKIKFPTIFNVSLTNNG